MNLKSREASQWLLALLNDIGIDELEAALDDACAYASVKPSKKTTSAVHIFEDDLHDFVCDWSSISKSTNSSRHNIPQNKGGGGGFNALINLVKKYSNQLKCAPPT